MIIEGSVYGFFVNAGQQSLQLPESGLTIVGISVSNQNISVPLDPSHNAIFLGTGLGYYFYKVRYKMSSSAFSFTTGGGGVLVTVYYGVPDSGNIPLVAFAGIANTVNFTVPASTSTLTPITQSLNVSFPSGAVQITTIDQGSGNLPTGIWAPNGVLFTIVSGTGKQLNVQLPLPALDAPILGGVVNSPSGLLPFQLSAALSVPITATVWATNSNTTATSFGVMLVVYYSYKG